MTSISYGAGEVVFHWQARPDLLDYGAGYALGTVRERLSIVEVRAAGQMLRTYALGYAQSVATGRSILTSVTERGRDSVIGGDGSVTGTALPPYEFAYTGAAPTINTLPSGSSFSYPDATGETVVISAGEFGPDRGMHTLHVYGQQERERIDDDSYYYRRYCVFQRSDVGQYARVELQYSSGNIVGNKFCPVYDVEIRFFRNVRNAAKALLYKFKYDWERSTTNNDYSGTATGGNYDQTPYGFPRVIADFDGDGLDDGLTFDVNIGNRQYYSGSASQNWSNVASTGSARDLNGDGLADLYFQSGSNVVVRRSNGVNGFVDVVNQSIAPVYTIHLTGDFNGDGVSDFLVSTNGSVDYRIFYMLGNRIQAGPLVSFGGSCALSQCGYNYVPAPSAADVDGDGRDDLIVHRRIDAGYTAHYSQVYLNRGGRFELVRGTDGGTDTFKGTVAYAADTDRNGMVELALRTDTRTVYGTGRYSLVSERADLLRLVRSPLGGETIAQYGYEAVEQDPDFPLGFPVVKRLEVRDGVSASAAVTDYAYEGGRWNWPHRRFLGFRKITATLPQIAGESGRPVIETLYRQDLASIGRIEQQQRKGGDGQLLEKREEVYAVQTTTQPYTSLNTESRHTVYLEGAARMTREVRTFDVYGQLRSQIHYGDSNRNGDEWTYTRWSYPNKDKYIVDRWAVETVNVGPVFHETNNRQWRRWHAYDGQGVSTPPVSGLRDRTWEWTGGEADEKRLLSSTAYDAYGNVVSEADGLGNTTSYVYDGVYHLYPEEVRNPLYDVDTRQKRRTDWDKVCGAPLIETDENGVQTQHGYDALCRKTRTDLPGGGYVRHAYVDWGVPGSSRMETVRPHPQGGEIAQQDRFDGLGRTVMSLQQGVGAEAGQGIRTDSEYDLRGNLLRQSAPYTTGESPVWSTFGYDGLDRQVSRTHPDGTRILTRYVPGDAFTAVETQDELSRKRVSHLDAHGNEVYRDRFEEGQLQRTVYGYDVLKRLTSIKDALGASWTYAYDGHGNQIAMSDPDLGCRQMTYDAAGRLASQRAASGSQTAYQYDKLGRATQRTLDKNALLFPDCGVRNTPPVGVDDAGFMTDWDKPLTIAAADLVANDRDGEGDGLTVIAVSAATHGTAVLSDNGSVVFTPEPGFIGKASLVYEVSDTWLSSTATVWINVKEPPVIPGSATFTTNASFTVPNYGILTISVNGNGGNPGNGGTTYGSSDNGWECSAGSVGASGSNNQVAISGISPIVGFGGAGGAGELPSPNNRCGHQLKPNPGGPGGASGGDQNIPGAGAPGLATLHPVGDGGPGGRAVKTFRSSDALKPVPGSVLSISVGSVGNRGGVTLSWGSNNANRGPVQTEVLPLVMATEGKRLDYRLPDNLFADPDGDMVSLRLRTAADGELPAWLGFDAWTRTLVANPTVGQAGTYALSLTISDGREVLAIPVRLEVLPETGIYDGPVALDDSGFATDWETPLTIPLSSLLRNDTDADGDVLTIVAVTALERGSVSLDASGRPVFVPTPNISGIGSFSYEVTDGKKTATAKVWINVRPPVIVPGSASYSSSGTFTVPNYQTLTISVSGNGGEQGRGGQTEGSSDNGWSCVAGTYGSGGSSNQALVPGIPPIVGGGGGGGRGEYAHPSERCGRQIKPGPGSVGGASGGDQIIPGGGAPGQSTAHPVGDGGPGGRAVKTIARSASNAPRPGSAISVSVGSTGNRGGVSISWQ